MIEFKEIICNSEKRITVIFKFNQIIKVLELLKVYHKEYKLLKYLFEGEGGKQ